MFTAETEFVVRYAETDQMGIVHHSNYPIWFEAGRTDFIKKMGLPYSKVEEMGFMLPLIELKCNYKNAAKYEDNIIVKTQLKEITPVRVVFYYQAFRKDEPVPLATGETYHVWTDKALKPVNIKKHSDEIYQLLKKSIL